jgi:hypothetical protein
MLQRLFFCAPTDLPNPITNTAATAAAAAAAAAVLNPAVFLSPCALGKHMRQAYWACTLYSCSSSSRHQRSSRHPSRCRHGCKGAAAGAAVLCCLGG